MSETNEGAGGHELSTRAVDHVATAMKLTLGSIPVAGPLLAEIAGNVIPNQRFDRLVKFTEALSRRLGELEDEYVRTQVANEQFTDLVEEAMRQASRSLSDDRREYIASLVATSLKAGAIEHAESKHLLRILGELNDVEVIWLRSYASMGIGADNEFRRRHAAMLDPVLAHMGSDQGEFDKLAVQKSYKAHLAELGLLEPSYELETSKTATKLNTKSYSLAPLGRLLLRQIGLPDFVTN